MKYSIPYGSKFLEVDTRGNKVVFEGKMTNIAPVADIKEELLKALRAPIASPSLAELAQGKKNILFLVEDNTRETPLDILLPIVVDYLNDNGIPDEAISFLTAPGTHRVMTQEEVRAKLGDEIVRRFKVEQHDATDSSLIADLGELDVEGYKLPVRINKLALEADLLIGVGNIVPHSDAGFSGGAKIVQPGICDFVTTQATHRAAGFCADIPLGVLDNNPCRAGIDAVGKIAKLAFIINVVKNQEGEVAGIFCGDYIEAHRAGSELARKSFCIEMDELADIVIASSYPADIDYWQGIKGVTSAYFAVKPGGVIILASPCYEGMAHNHPLYAQWLAAPIEEVRKGIMEASPYDTDTDIISAVVALDGCRARERAKIYMVSEGLTPEQIRGICYTPAKTIQEALDAAIAAKPDATIGLLPLGGISLPVLKRS